MDGRSCDDKAEGKRPSVGTLGAIPGQCHGILGFRSWIENDGVDCWRVAAAGLAQESAWSTSTALSEDIPDSSEYWDLKRWNQRQLTSSTYMGRAVLETFFFLYLGDRKGGSRYPMHK